MSETGSMQKKIGQNEQQPEMRIGVEKINDAQELVGLELTP